MNSAFSLFQEPFWQHAVSVSQLGFSRRGGESRREGAKWHRVRCVAKTVGRPVRISPKLFVTTGIGLVYRGVRAENGGRHFRWQPAYKAETPFTVARRLYGPCRETGRRDS